MAKRPISLSAARKAKTRAGNRAEADANAARFGRTKAEVARDAASASRSVARLEAHRIDREEPPGGS